MPDVDVIIGVLFALVSFGAWIIKAINNNEEPVRKKPGGRPKDRQVRQEIEEFLEQQGGRRPRPTEVRPEDIELVEEESPRRRPSPVVKPARTPRTSQKAAAPPRPPVKAPVQPAPRASALPTQVTKRGELPLGSSDMGAGLREHVRSTMGERVMAQAQRDLPRLATSVDQKVREDLGVFSVTGKTDAVRSTSSPLVLMLQNPKTARQAVLMAEIMGRPKALRK